MPNKADPFDLRFSRHTTSQEVLERSAYALAAALTVNVAEDDDAWIVTIHPRSAAAGDELAHRFRQEVTDQALRSRIAERTDPIRTLVWALAFSKTGLAETPES